MNLFSLAWTYKQIRYCASERQHRKSQKTDTINATNLIAIKTRPDTRERCAIRRYRQMNETVLQSLEQKGLGILDEEGDVISMLMTSATEKGMSESEVESMLRIGENIAGALWKDDCYAGGELVLKDGTKITNSIYLTRCISWYLMAVAARQDLARKKNGAVTGMTDMAETGSFRLQDPYNNLYKFLCSAPLVGNRMSTHYNEMLSEPARHWIGGIIPTNRSAHKGTDDYERKLPGKGGAILFNKLAGNGQTPEIYVKFESAGMPRVFGHEPHHTYEDRSERFFLAMGRNLSHMVNFLRSRSNGYHKKGDARTRLENVHKGSLRKKIYEPAKTLCDFAIDAKVFAKHDKKWFLNKIRDYGIAGVRELLSDARFIQLFSDEKNGNLAGKRADLKAQVARFAYTLDEVLKAYPNPYLKPDAHHSCIHDGAMYRRGDEVHLSYDPALYPRKDEKQSGSRRQGISTKEIKTFTDMRLRQAPFEKPFDAASIAREYYGGLKNYGDTINSLQSKYDEIISQIDNLQENSNIKVSLKNLLKQKENWEKNWDSSDYKKYAEYLVSEFKRIKICRNTAYLFDNHALKNDCDTELNGISGRLSQLVWLKNFGELKLQHERTYFKDDWHLNTFQSALAKSQGSNAMRIETPRVSVHPSTEELDIDDIKFETRSEN